MNDSNVLLVDDDANVLQACQRILRKRFNIVTAGGSDAALAAIKLKGPFAVIVCDMNMPCENGIQLLQKIIKKSPDSVRIMLTGNADQKTASDAINLGKVFRFLHKPCYAEQLAEAIEAAIEHYRHIVAEQELLTQTVHGSIRMLTEILSAANPVAFGRAARLHQLIVELIRHVHLEQPWECEMAAMLSQVGCISIPAATLDKAHQGKSLLPAEVRLLAGRYRMGYDFIHQVPRLENVAEIVRLQDDCYLAQEPPGGLPLAAHLLRIARDFDSLLQVHRERHLALARLEQRACNYHPEALAALRLVVDNHQEYEPRTSKVAGLREGWLLADDVRTTDGLLLVKEGQLITAAMLARLENHYRTSTIAEPLAVLVPLEKAIKPSPSLSVANA
jgi:response regulator RpfG family c-di-GMP phosphodiesterase